MSATPAKHPGSSTPPLSFSPHLGMKAKLMCDESVTCFFPSLKVKNPAWTVSTSLPTHAPTEFLWAHTLVKLVLAL